MTNTTNMTTFSQIAARTQAHANAAPSTNLRSGRDNRYTTSSKPHEKSSMTTKTEHQREHETPATYEFIDDSQLAERIRMTTAWVKRHSRAQAADPIPSASFGRSKRYAWNSPALLAWLARRMNGNSGKGRR
jgi:hypothetical protein